MADLAKVRRNVARLVQQGAPDSDIDEYVASEGTSLEALRAHKAQQALPELDASNKAAAAHPLYQLGHNFTRALVPGADRMTAGVEAAIAKVRGDDRDYGAVYDEKLKGQFALTNAVKNQTGLLGHTGTALGWTAGGMGLAKVLPEALVVAGTPAAEMAPTLKEVSKESARVGGGFGMLQAWLDSQKTDPVERGKDAALGLVGGGTIGAAAPTVVLGVGNASLSAKQALERLWGGNPQHRALNRERLHEWNDAGVTPLAPAVSQSKLSTPTARAIAESVAGGEMRAAASTSMQDVARAANSELAAHTGGRPSTDLGAEIQDTLRRQFLRDSIPREQVRRAPDAELERMTGPVTNEGFAPHRRIVEPEPVYPMFEDIQIRPEQADKIARARAEREQAFNDLLKSHDPSLQAEERAAWNSHNSAKLREHERAIAEAEEPQRQAWQEAVRIEHQRAVAAAEAETMRLWDADRAAHPGFEFGRSRESYKTEAAAAYERTFREAPPIQRNPLGGEGMSGIPSHAPYRTTATETLLDDIAVQARGTGLLKGYKSNQLFGPEGFGRADVGERMSQLFGPEIADRLGQLGISRHLKQPAPGVQGLRDLHTMVKTAAREAERPPYPGTPRPESAAALRRLQGAMESDLHTFLREAGPRGKRSSQMFQEVDRAYAGLINDVRKPLAGVFGEKVSPNEALTTVVTAAQGPNPDLQTLRALMRVAREKADPDKMAAAVVAHATGHAASFHDFMQGFSAIPKQARDVLMSSEGGRRMRANLERLERIGSELKPFERAVRDGGHHLSSRGNLALSVLWGVSNFYHALTVAAGTAVASRVMTSPRYLSYITRVPKPSTRDAWEPVARQIAIAAQGDADMGSAVLEALKTMQPAKARGDVHDDQ